MLKNLKLTLFISTIFVVFFNNSLSITTIACPPTPDYKNCLTCKDENDNDLKNCSSCKPSFFSSLPSVPLLLEQKEGIKAIQLCQEKCQQHCTSCTTIDNCMECESGFYLSLESDLKCQACSQGCIKCKNENTCLSCSGNYMLNSNNQCDNIRTKQLLVIVVIMIYILAIAGWCSWQLFTQTQIYRKRKTKKILTEELVTPKSVYKRETL